MPEGRPSTPQSARLARVLGHVRPAAAPLTLRARVVEACEASHEASAAALDTVEDIDAIVCQSILERRGNTPAVRAQLRAARRALRSVGPDPECLREPDAS